MNVKQILSRLNHQIRWNRAASRMSAQVQASALATDTVPWEEVKELLGMLQPMQTEHDLVRLGPDHDGGYLVPDDMEDIRAVFSPGVSVTLGFDLEMAQRCDHCYLADASVEEPKGLRENMSFIKKFIGPQNDPQFISLEDWVEGNEPGEEDLQVRCLHPNLQAR